jgi:hypothetical protein
MWNTLFLCIKIYQNYQQMGFGLMNATLLYSDHRHVLATHVAIFIVSSVRIQIRVYLQCVGTTAVLFKILLNRKTVMSIKHCKLNIVVWCVCSLEQRTQQVCMRGGLWSWLESDGVVCPALCSERCSYFVQHHDCRRVGCDTTQAGRKVLVCQRNLLSPVPGSKMKAEWSSILLPFI